MNKKLCGSQNFLWTAKFFVQWNYSFIIIIITKMASRRQLTTDEELEQEDNNEADTTENESNNNSGNSDQYGDDDRSSAGIEEQLETLATVHAAKIVKKPPTSGTSKKGASYTLQESMAILLSVWKLRLRGKWEQLKSNLNKLHLCLDSIITNNILFTAQEVQTPLKTISTTVSKLGRNSISHLKLLKKVLK